jgi:hypothetical protein
VRNELLSKSAETAYWEVSRLAGERLSLKMETRNGYVNSSHVHSRDSTTHKPMLQYVVYRD